jgi:hypothetical protein
MKKPLLFFLLLICAYPLLSQQVNTSSGSAQKGEFSAEWIIGGSLIDNSVFSLLTEENAYIYEMPNIGLIDVYPTATRDYLTITFTDSLNSMLNFRIINNMGNIFLKGNTNISSPYELDVKDLAAGYYIIAFSRPDNQSFCVYKRFIKL